MCDGWNMSIFNINNNINTNKQNVNAYYDKYKRVSSTGTPQTKNNNVYFRYSKNVYDQNNKSYVETDSVFPSNNYLSAISQDWTPQAIREFKYNILLNRFEEDYPLTFTYNLCPQNLSTVFQIHNGYWSRSRKDNYSVHPKKNTLLQITQRENRDCGSCSLPNFTGEYLLNWSIDNGPQLLSSTNPDVVLGTFTFHVEDGFFDIFLYPDNTLNSTSYLHIRYRVPVRWRHFYGDWTFWESVLINGEMSETEFVRIINL